MEAPHAHFQSNMSTLFNKFYSTLHAHSSIFQQRISVLKALFLLRIFSFTSASFILFEQLDFTLYHYSFSYFYTASRAISLCSRVLFNFTLDLFSLYKTLFLPRIRFAHGLYFVDSLLRNTTLSAQHLLLLSLLQRLFLHCFTTSFQLIYNYFLHSILHYISTLICPFSIASQHFLQCV